MAETKAKATVKAETAESVVAKEEVKKETVKKAAPAKKAPAKKAEAKAVVHLQFDGKSYTNDDLIKIAKDVWKYDLGNKPADFKSVELYVKPEDSRAYYVVNGEITGSFAI
ncbi:MAG: hypothetical protein J6A11_09935 [Lachnospiraceae bacterium]|nr:hypothetical protein [Lachnospiraceae bacterium]